MQILARATRLGSLITADAVQRVVTGGDPEAELRLLSPPPDDNSSDEGGDAAGRALPEASAEDKADEAD